MSAQETNVVSKRSIPEPRNGVNTTDFFATLDVVGANPELANFQWRVQNTWQSGTHSRSEFNSFSGAGGEQKHRMVYKADADHPEVLVGDDMGPTPVEYILHALASCLTAGIANIASARSIDIHEVSSNVEGNIDLQGILGLNKNVRNGFSDIRVSFKIKADATEEMIRTIVEQSIARSAVFDVITNGVSVDVCVNENH